MKIIIWVFLFVTLLIVFSCQAWKSSILNMNTNNVPANTSISTGMQVGDVLRVSVSSNGTQANGASEMSPQVGISLTGRYVAFESDASNLVDNDTNGVKDVFRYDVETRTIIRISVSDSEAESDAISEVGYISGDGNLVAFHSSSVALGTNGNNQVFVRNVSAGTTTLVSKNIVGTQADGSSHDSYISQDGKYVSFVSSASNLTGDSVAGVGHCYRVSLIDGSIELFSKSTAGVVGTYGGGSVCGHPKLNGNGDIATFYARSNNLAAALPDTNPRSYYHNFNTGETILVSRKLDTTPTDASAYTIVPNYDGSILAFHSWATGITVDPDTNAVEDVYLYNRGTTAKTLVSMTSAGSAGDGRSYVPCLSNDGNKVAFNSESTDLDDSIVDNNGSMDIFVYDVALDQLKLMSKNSAGVLSNGVSHRGNLSGDGKYLVFQSDASNLVNDDTNGVYDIFIKRLE